MARGCSYEAKRKGARMATCLYLSEVLAYYANACVPDHSTWSKATGLNTPPMVRMSMAAASSTESVQGVFDLVTTVTKGQATASTTSYTDDACDITTITLSGDQNLPVIYIFIRRLSPLLTCHHASSPPVPVESLWYPNLFENNLIVEIIILFFHLGCCTMPQE
jgi:hypothetical protein